MLELNTLRGIDSREAARVLAALSRTLLPDPGIAESSSKPEMDADVLESLLAEIRHRLRIRDDDFSLDTKSKIYDFLSRELSKAALADTSEKSVKDRLGNKGELRPDQYGVVISEQTTQIIEALGNKRHHVIDAITHPDSVVHLHGSYTGEDDDVRPTISIKSVSGRRADHDFILLVISYREGQVQEIEAAFRVYRSDVEIRATSNPMDILKAFVQTYGLTFQVGSEVSKYIENQVLGVNPFGPYDIALQKEMHPLDGAKGDYYYPVIAGAQTHIHAPHSQTVTVRIVFAFIVNISKYAATLRRHRVAPPEMHLKFLTI